MKWLMARPKSCSDTKLSPALLTLCLLVASVARLASAQDIHAIADKVDQRYNHIQTLKADFTETYSGGGAARTETGTLLLKKPGRMRWDYVQPRAKLFVTDGKIAWFYVPGEHQARRASVKQTDDLRSPLRYLLGKTKLDKELDGLSLDSAQKPTTAGNFVLRGIPKGMSDRVSQTLLEVTPEGLITRIVIEELDGSTTEFRFQAQQENVKLEDAQFSFSPPPGVEIVAGTEMMQ
jgi:outer membrane lipoprotein carrier protein